MTETISVRTRTPMTRGLPRGLARRMAPIGVTFIAMAVILIVCMSLQPTILSTSGLTLVFSTIVPLVLVSLAQMTVMSIGDIDLSVGSFVGLVTGISATVLRESPLLGFLMLIGLIAAYAALGALIHLRKLPSLIATLGASFVWLGLGLTLLPTPGGMAPDWLFTYSSWEPPLIPTPILVMLVAGVLSYLVMQKTRWGSQMRAFGSNTTLLSRSSSSPLKVRVLAYALAGVFGILSGLALSAEIGGGDVSAPQGYTLLSVAAVVLGGGTFFGGRANSWGSIFGAVTLGLLTVLLTLLNLPSAIQPAIQGGIIFVALAGRLLIEKVVK